MPTSSHSPHRTRVLPQTSSPSTRRRSTSSVRSARRGCAHWRRCVLPVYGTTPSANEHTVPKQTITQSLVIFEIATILATYLPSPYAERILPMLAWRPATSALGVRITSPFLLGTLLCAVGGVMRIFCYRALGRHFTFELSLRKDHKLVTDGPYSIVRHPSYTALIMVTIGTLLCLTSTGSWLSESGIMGTLIGRLLIAAWAAEVTWIPIVMIMRVGTEDEILRNEFRDEWLAWSKRTPYKLIPGLI
ncbi:hypothetical protein C8T65DRAFT_633661 [Cerioporus squamosus]|nr:hypothetical protein C8T65DRAFT_633661 [Cerioporus squamosus]